MVHSGHGGLIRGLALLAAATALSMTPAFAAENRPERKLLVIAQGLPRTSPADMGADPEVRKLAEYETMHAIAIPEGAADRIASRLVKVGFEVRELEDVIRTPRTNILTTSRKAPVAPFESGLFLLQYAAPPTSGWQAVVRQSGVRVIDYLPERALIVAGTSRQIAALAAQPWIQYAGPYLPEHKTGPVADVNHELFLVQVADTPDSARDLESLRARLGDFIHEARHGSDTVVRIRTDLTTARELLDEPYVVAVEAYVTPGLSDERQALGITGVATLTPSMTPYLNWLQARGIEPNNLTNDTWGRQIIVDVADTGIDLGCCNSVVIRHLDLYGRIVYNNETITSTGSCERADTHGHGTVVASIVGGVPGQGQDTAQSTTTGFGYRDSDSRGQYFYGLGVAPGVRLGNTRISDPAFGSVNDWTRRAVTQRCNNTTLLCSQNELCPATVQNHSHNEYDDTGSRAGVYTLSSREFDFRVRDANNTDDAQTITNTPLTVTIAAGNYHQRVNDITTMVMASATAKNVISMGAVESHRTASSWPNQSTLTVAPLTCTPAGDAEAALRHSAGAFNVLAFMSRRGTKDGRLKPDLLAPATLSFGGHVSKNAAKYCAVGPAVVQGQSWPQYHGSSGTSFAAPVAAGSVALLRYYYTKNHGLTPSPAMYKAMLVAGARSITGGTDRLETYLQGVARTVVKWPNAQQGFGVVNLTDLLAAAPVKSWRDQSTVLLSGQSVSYTVTVADPTKPLQAVLAWTDTPAAARATTDTTLVLVNDLDLSATGSTFRVYGNLTGNDGFSFVNPGCARPICRFGDGTNNVEALNVNPSVFTDPANRTFTVRVNAPLIQGVGVPGASGGAYNQDFALFVINGTVQ